METMLVFALWLHAQPVAGPMEITQPEPVVDISAASIPPVPDIGAPVFEFGPAPEPPAASPIRRIPIIGNIFRAFEHALLRPAARCWEWEKIDWRVRKVVLDTARHFHGSALMTSCYRSAAYNREVYARMGRAPTRSQHILHKAIDFKIAGISRDRVAAYARNLPLMQKIGGVGRYAGSDIIHVDSGPKRDWCWGCSRSYAGHAAVRSAARHSHRAVRSADHHHHWRTAARHPRPHAADERAVASW